MNGGSDCLKKSSNSHFMLIAYCYWVPALFSWIEKMEVDQGKLFIGGISWDTNEDRLTEYFGAYGEVMEAVIMRDRSTGRARGFGFVVFADPMVAERVVKEKHVIDGRTVEAKKAVPRDDQYLITRNHGNSIRGSPGPGQTKKIFVGGLASSVTEADFKNYFNHFGNITDVVVMYDHITQRPRGFGFITYDSEDAVDRVLHKTFHELNGKMVEVKRAVPKELSHGPSRSPVIGYNYGFSRTNNLLTSHAPGYNLGSLGAYGIRMDGRFSPLASARAAFSNLGSPTYGTNLGAGQGMNACFAGASSGSRNDIGSGHAVNSYFNNNQGRYNTPICYNANNSRRDSFLHSLSTNTWGNAGLNTSPNNVNFVPYSGSETGDFGVFGNSRQNWGGSPFATLFGGSSSVYRGGENSNSLGAVGLGRNGGMGAATTSSFAASGGGFEGSFRDFYQGGANYGDSTWQTASSELNGSDSFGYGLGHSEEDFAKDSDYMVGYSIPTSRSSRGIAA
ncbi:heterogeneous nuclear ribonucleoprotein 1-like isoform X2 [Primulina tabacum]|uniref:heterogeneous nuclear ribonucleoprotein 1-like isoform X2 n=1 Tax=Primulina tabacum TaxID=48773 RepID=UPI003F598EB0